MEFTFNIEGVSVFSLPLPLDQAIENKFSEWLPVDLEQSASTRKQEFIAGRYCAVQAAKNIGLQILSLPTSVSREPVWPLGIRGSISHSKLMAISCVTDSNKFLSVGIDTEEKMSKVLSLEVENVIASEDELQMLKNIEAELGLTILFSAKESLYKALFPLAKTFIDFKEVLLTKLSLKEETFELKLQSGNTKLRSYLGHYQGSFKVINGTVVTIVLIRNLVEESHVYS